jgi:tetratricopeptide (TPR) repeat protein
MTRYSRIPAAIILLASVLAGGVYLYAQARAAGAGGGGSLKELEVAIGGNDVTATTWFRYGEALQKVERYADAATAYQRALDMEPYNRDARLQRAIALALDKKADAFYACMRDLVIVDPKMAVDVFGRPEAQIYLSQPRFKVVAADAQAQSID